jgi:hypothetical protein
MACLADPYILFHYGSVFPGYSHFSELISELGSSDSPVTKLFSAWWVISGIFFLAFAAALYYSYGEHGRIAVTATWLVVLYATGDCILSGFFPDDHFHGGELTFASKVHVATGAVGIFALLAFPLVMRKIITKERSIYFFNFSLIVFFTGMLMAVLLFFRYCYVPYLSDLQGLWQRIMMFTFYVYFIVLAGMMMKKLKPEI